METEAKVKSQVELITAEPTIAGGIPELGVIARNGQAMVSSNALAKIFGKRHDNVLRDIERARADMPEDYAHLNFEACYYKVNGRKRKAVAMTLDGFAIIAMGFTGKKAMSFKIAIMAALRQLAGVIQTRQLGKSSYKDACGTGRSLGLLRSPIEYAAEANMIYTVVLGDKASRLKAKMGLPPNGSIRDNLDDANLDRLDRAHVLDGELMRAGFDHYERAAIVRRAINP